MIDYNLHGLAGVRVVGATARDAAAVDRQLGPIRGPLRRDPDIVVFGEDVGYFGGVFRVTDGLQKKFGEHRVFDTPISEAALVGLAVGAAIYDTVATMLDASKFLGTVPA